MFSTDNLFFLVIFLIPGASYILYNRYLRAIPRLEKDETVRLSSALMFSFIVFGGISFILGNSYIKFLNQETIFDDVFLLAFVVGCNVGLSFMLCILWAFAKSYIFTPFINKFNSLLKRPPESEHELLWDYLTETKGLIDINCCIVTIEKDGIIMSGKISAFPASVTEKMEFLLIDTHKVEKTLAEDACKEEEDKILGKVNYVYVDVNNGLKITFYDNTKYKTIS